MGWKSKKDGTHFNTDKTVRSSEPSAEVNIEIDNNSEEFSEGVKKDFEDMNQPFPVNTTKYHIPKEYITPERQAVIDGGIAIRKASDMIKSNNFPYGGRTYNIDYDQRYQTISIDETYEDSNGTWHKKPNGFFVYGEDASEIARDSGGWHVDTLIAYIESGGALQELNARKGMYQKGYSGK